MSNKLLGYLAAGALAAALALASPALAGGRGGGGGGGGGHSMGGGGGMGGGMHAMGGGMGGGMGMHSMGSGMHPMGFSRIGAGPRFSGVSPGPHFATSPFAARAAFTPQRFAFNPAFHPRFFHHHRFHRFAFIGGPYIYADYDYCWRQVWTRYGLQWVNVCGDYGYGY